jgi:hypothetical protein
MNPNKAKLICGRVLSSYYSHEEACDHVYGVAVVPQPLRRG